VIHTTLVWATPDAERMLVQIARVSSPQNQADMGTGPRLIRYLIRHHHWSPFEMVAACVLVEGVSRAITRQMIRHRSFAFQEFSTRYAAPARIDCAPPVRVRAIGGSRQGGRAPTDVEEVERAAEWAVMRDELVDRAREVYDRGVALGVAKECLRDVLPEGLTASRLYMQGTLRSWIHYFQVRTSDDTQSEHRMVATAMLAALRPAFPFVLGELFPRSPEERHAELPL